MTNAHEGFVVRNFFFAPCTCRPAGCGLGLLPTVPRPGAYLIHPLMPVADTRVNCNVDGRVYMQAEHS
jgi:hypothetical protein